MAGSGSVELTVEVHYAGTRALRRAIATPSITVDVGSVGLVSATEGGGFRATWSMPDAYDGREQASARVVAPTGSGEPLDAVASLTLSPGPASELELSVDDDELVADGHTGTVVHLRARDAHGNDAGELGALERTVAGRLGPFQPTGPGLWDADYSTPMLRRPDVDRIEVRLAEGGTGTVQVRLQATGRPIIIDLRAGYLTNFGKVRAPLFLGGVTFRLPFLREAMSVGLTTGFFTGRDQSRASNDSERVSLRVWGVPVLLRMAYRLYFDHVQLDVTLLTGAVIAQRELSSETTGRRVTRDLRWAVGGGVAPSFAVGPGRLVLDVGYLHAPVTGFVRGNLAGLYSLVGYALRLCARRRRSQRPLLCSRMFW